VDAREVGLGQATMASVDDATAFHWNPAGLGMVRSFDAAASYSRLYAGLASHQMVAVGAAVDQRLRVGLSWVRLGVDNIPAYAPFPAFSDARSREEQAKQGPIGTFGYSQNAAYLTVAWQTSREVALGWQYLTLPMELPIGATIKYLAVSAGDTISGSAIGLDLGAQARFPLSRAFDNRLLGDMSLGLAIANVGRTRMTWDTPSRRGDTEPMQLRYGAAYEQPLAIIRSAVVLAMSGAGAKRGWGLEYRFLDELSLRMGKDMIAENGVSFGAGIGWRGLRLDYALQRHDLGITHRVSLHYRH